MTPLTDTHTHLFVEEFDTDRDLAIIRARESGVYRLFMPNIDETTVEAMLATCKAHPACYPMIGLHPTSVDQDWKEKLAAVEKWLRGPETFFGIGEVGIDLYWDRTFRDEQMQAFDLQVQWALEVGLPLSIHARNAYPEVLEVLEPYRKEPALSGVFHCFSGTEEEASRLLAFDRFMLGINGTVTFKKSTLPEVLKSFRWKDWFWKPILPTWLLFPSAENGTKALFWYMSPKNYPIYSDSPSIRLPRKPPRMP